MRKFITILIATIAFVSCGAESENKIQNTDFVGKWKWTGTHGGFADHLHETPASTETTLELNLMSNYTFTILKDGKEVMIGKYDLTTIKSIYTGEMEQYITCDMSNNPDGRYFVTNGVIKIHDKNKLSIDDNNYDGIGSQFERIE